MIEKTNSIIYIAIYILANALIIAFVLAARNQCRDFIKSILQYYRKNGWDFNASRFKKIAQKILTILVVGICFCLIIITLPLLSILIMKDLQRILQDEKHEKEYGFIQKVAGKVILEGFVYSISQIKLSVFDNEKIFIDINLVIYPQKGCSQHYIVICYNELAKEVERDINRHCKIRIDGTNETIKTKNKQGIVGKSEIIQAEKVELLRVENPLTFNYIGGAGIIQCFQCKHRENIISFIHGDYRSILGYQCQECGKVHKVRSISEESRKINIVDSLVCDCGGILEREKTLFCPKCKSKRLIYEMSYIT